MIEAPSARARELVQGGYDIHVHVAPDVMERRIDDYALAARFGERGMAGFVLKSHYVPTAERAAVVRAARPGIDAVGAITLNRSVGGLNPVAVEIAARGGAKFVWLPTVDSVNERKSFGRLPEGATPPMWAAVQNALRAQGVDAGPVPVLDASGEPLPDLVAVLRLIARHDLTLATGHLSAAETVLVAELALELGVRHIVVTHPEFPSQSIGPADQRRLAEAGVLLERCLTTALTGKVGWDEWLAHIREAGPESSVIGSDLGQPFNPPVEDGLAMVADILIANGFTDEQIRTMVVHNGRRLVGATTLSDAP